MVSERAGKLASINDLIDLDLLIDSYYDYSVDPFEDSQKIVFGTSGHRGSSFIGSFNEPHIIAITSSILEYRKKQGISGPIFIGFDTHALSFPAFKTVVEVLGATGVDFIVDSNLLYTPTPAVSHAILQYNKDKTKKQNLSDGIIITPSHNPPTDGGIKYNPPSGGPASTTVANEIAQRANELLRHYVKKIARQQYENAINSAIRYDFTTNYVKDLKNIIDMDKIASSGLRIGADPLGGASVKYWQQIAQDYKLNLTVLNTKVDPSFYFIALDWDGKIRMDCSSKYTMAPLVKLMTGNSVKFDIVTGNDADSDRHGIVTPVINQDNKSGVTGGLMNPNYYYAVAIKYLFETRKKWNPNAKIGKTIVSSSIINKIASSIKKQVFEVPVGFKWFSDGLLDGSLGFAGEESAGASFLRADGSVWTTDKDGIIPSLLASEITASYGKNPSQIYNELTNEFGSSWYARVDAQSNSKINQALLSIENSSIDMQYLGTEKVTCRATNASGNNEKIGGVKVSTKNNWFAARPSGTEPIYKIYAESFLSAIELEQTQLQAQEYINSLIL